MSISNNDFLRRFTGRIEHITKNGDITAAPFSELRQLSKSTLHGQDYGHFLPKITEYRRTNSLLRTGIGRTTDNQQRSRGERIQF